MKMTLNEMYSYLKEQYMKDYKYSCSDDQLVRKATRFAVRNTVSEWRKQWTT